MQTEAPSYGSRREAREAARRVEDDAPSVRERPLSVEHTDDGDDGARAHHATGRGDGFGRLVGWTVLGTVLPGTGLIAAGRRRWGWAVLLPVLFVAGALGAVVASGRAVALARQYAFRADVMLALAIGAVALALAWCLLVVATHLALRRERLTGGQRALSVLLVAALMALVVVPAATATRYAMANRRLLLTVFGSRLHGTGPDATAANPWAGTPRVNVLLVGADSSQGHLGTRPDSVMVASVDTRTGDAVLVGLPRNLEYFSLAGDTAAAAAWPAGCAANGATGCELNAAYLFGQQHASLFPGARDPGVEATRDAAAWITGLPISYEMMVNLDGFEDLVNAMGGITLTVPTRIDIGGGWIIDDRGRTVGQYPVTGHVPAGTDEHLNGYQAEWYVRSRWPTTTTDNYVRMQRQRCFVNAAVHQYSVTALATKFPQLAATAEQDFETDIPSSQLNAFVDLGMSVKKSGSLRTLAIDKALANEDGTSHPDYSHLRQLVQQALHPAAATSPSGASSPTTAPSPAAAASTGSTRSARSARSTGSAAADGADGAAQDAAASCPS